MNLIVTHVHGDFDGLAAVVAASKIYPGSSCFLPQPYHQNVRSFVNLYRDLLPLSDSPRFEDPPDLAVVVDTRRASRLGPYAALVKQAIRVHLYDHHPDSGDELEGERLFFQPLGATTTILVEEIERRNLPLTSLEATLFALGIYEDTGSLSLGSTTERDVAAVSYLWQKGLQVEILQEYLRPSLTTGQRGLLEKLLSGLECFEIRKRRVMVASADADEYIYGAAALARYLFETEEVELLVTLVQMPGAVYMAARTYADDLDLTILLAPLMAKGHRQAVSASIPRADYRLVREELLEMLQKYLPLPVTAGQIASVPVNAVSSGVSAGDALELLARFGHGGFPVMEDGRMVGIVSRRDLQKAMRNNLDHAPIRGFMSRRVATASPDEPVTALRRTMVEKNIGRLPLLGGGGELVGIVTRSDILRALYRLDRRGAAIGEEESLLKLPKPEISICTVDNLLPLFTGKLPGRLQSLMLLAGQRAVKVGAELYLVGGMLRDLLLGRPLPADLDFIVLPDAIAFAFELQKYFGGRLKTYEQFGTATLLLDEGLRLDLATARREFYASPAALPKVESSSLKNDLYRRDFTINTLACSLLPEKYGMLVDFFGGLRDLEQGIIRTLYNLSFVDDPLRILRAVRFEQRLNFTIEQETLTNLRKAVHGRALEKVSRQRLNHEVSFIYQEDSPTQILQRLNELGALKFIYPGISPSFKTWQRLARVSETLRWSRQKEWEHPPDAGLLYLSALIYDLNSDDRTNLIRRLRFSREKALSVLTTCSETGQLLVELSGERLRSSYLVNLLDPLPPEALLLTHALAENGQVKDYVGLYLDSLRRVRPKLRGGDLKELGLEPGPLYRQILKELKEAILDGRVRTPEEELHFVISYLQRGKESISEL